MNRGLPLLSSCWLFVAIGTGITPLASAVGGPENVVLVVNADSWASTRLANEYARLRQIPPANVIRLSDVPGFERLDVETFRQRILLPVLKAIDDRRLAPQIDAIVYSSDFPTTIDVRGDLGGRQPPPPLTTDAAINGLTYLFPLVMAKDARYLDLQSNLYARRMVRATTDTPWTQEEQQRLGEALRKLDKNAKPQREDLAAAYDSLAELRKAHPRAPELLYNLACLEARLERLDDALKTLDQAVQHGWFDQRHTRNDPDLAGLRERAEFPQLLEKMQANQPEIQPYCQFRGSVGWSLAGEPTPPDRGMRYVISTMLGYTSGRGLSVGESLEQLRRSAAADHTRPTGTIYFPFNGDVRSTTREWGFRPAAAALEKLGVRAVVAEGVLPQAKDDVAGAVLGTADFNWPASGSRILPGAICEHLTSFGGMLASDAGQTPLSELLRHGAAGASGTVTEPYAIQAKFPTPFIQVAYANGLTLGEAFYQSVAGPYQLLIVGDALCRPWGRTVEVQVEGLPGDGVVRGELKLLATSPQAAAGLPAPTADEPRSRVAFEWFVDGRGFATVEPGQPLVLDTNRLPDGPHELVVAVQRAARLPVVGRQRLRILVRNQDTVLTTEGFAAREFPWDQPIGLSAALTGASEIEFMHQGRKVGRISGANGQSSLDPRMLGAGPARLQPVGRVNQREVWGEPIDVDVVPPAALPARALPPSARLVDGLQLHPAGHDAVVVPATKGDWLAKAGVAADTPWSLEAWFEVPTRDVYQFQLGGPARAAKVLVDDTPLDWPGNPLWRFLPVHLDAGKHRLRIESSGSNPPELDVRFGGPGTRWLDGSRFQHVE